VLEYKNGVRADATVFAVVSFLMKLAAGFASTYPGHGKWCCNSSICPSRRLGIDFFTIGIFISDYQKSNRGCPYRIAQTPQ